MSLKAGRKGLLSSLVDSAGRLKSSAISVAKGSKSVFGILKVGNNLNVSSGVVSAPIATTSALGVVQVGSGLSITDEGVLSASGGGGGWGTPVAYSQSEAIQVQTAPSDGIIVFDLTFTNAGANVSAGGQSWKTPSGAVSMMLPVKSGWNFWVIGTITTFTRFWFIPFA